MHLRAMVLLGLVVMGNGGWASGQADGPAASATDPGTAPAEPLAPVDTGWARASAIIGFVSAGAVFGLTAGSAVTVYDDEPISPVVGGIGMLLATAWTPTTYSAGLTVREQAGLSLGSPGLRATAWAFYGLSLADALAQVIMFAAGVTPIEGLVWTYGGLATASVALMSVDTLLVAQDAEALPAPDSSRPDGAGATGIHLAPAVTPVMALDGCGASGATLGLAGRF